MGYTRYTIVYPIVDSGVTITYCLRTVNAFVSLSVCLSVCLSVRSHISETTRPNFTKFVCLLTAAVGCSVPHWCHCDMLWTSGFVDDVTFSMSCSGGLHVFLSNEKIV